MNEEIQFGMGLDTGKFFTGIKKAKGGLSDLKADAASFGSSLAEAFGGAAVITSIAVIGQKVMEFGEQIKRGAEIAGVSTDFFQDFGAAMRQTGGDAEKAKTGLEKLSALIGQAREGNTEAQATFDKLGISIVDAAGEYKGTEQVIKEISNLMHGAADANAAAAIAVDVFGKKIGLELVPALTGGAEAIDKFGKASSKLSDQDLKSISEFKQEMDSAGNTALVWAGKTVSGIVSVAKALGTIAGGGFEAYFVGDNEFKGANESFEHRNKVNAQKAQESHDDKIKKSKEMIAALKELRDVRAESPGGSNEETKMAYAMADEKELREQLATLKKDSIEYVKMETEIEKEHNKVLEARQKIQDKQDKDKKEADRKKTEEEKKQHEFLKEQASLNYEINHAEEEINKATNASKNAREKRSQLSIEDLTTSGFHYRGTLGMDQRNAFDIKELERQGEWNRIHGFTDASKERYSRADELRKTFSTDVLESERLPFKSIDEGVKETNEHLTKLLDMADTDGIPVEVTLRD